MSQLTRCPVCKSASSEEFGRCLVLDRHPADFSRCQGCGCVYADDPYWLTEAYADAIARQDIGLITRNVTLARRTERLLATHFRGARTFLDFGAGTGMFVRLMRDVGYDFRYFDEYGPNLYAHGHGVTDVRGFDIVTAFELLEHLADPIATLAPAAESADVLIATTEVLPDPPPRLGGWWYYAPYSGQHITFYTPASLDRLSEQLGFHRTSVGSLHVFARRRMSRLGVQVALNAAVGSTVVRLRRRPSLLERDFLHLTGHDLQAGSRTKRRRVGGEWW